MSDTALLAASRPKGSRSFRELCQRSISRQLQVYIGAAAALALGLTVWVGYRVTRHELELQTNAKAMAPLNDPLAAPRNRGIAVGQLRFL